MSKDTIDHQTIEDAARTLVSADVQHMFSVVHTVTLILNGRHGGCDLILDGDNLQDGTSLKVTIPFGSGLADANDITIDLQK